MFSLILIFSIAYLTKKINSKLLIFQQARQTPLKQKLQALPGSLAQDAVEQSTAGVTGGTTGGTTGGKQVAQDIVLIENACDVESPVCPGPEQSRRVAVLVVPQAPIVPVQDPEFPPSPDVGEVQPVEFVTAYEAALLPDQLIEIVVHVDDSVIELIVGATGGVTGGTTGGLTGGLTGGTTGGTTGGATQL